MKLAGRSGAAFAPVPQVHERQDWMAQEHTGTRIAHHRAHLLAHVRCAVHPAAPRSSVAMYLAIGAGGLVRSERALLNALQGVRQQGGAIRAELGRVVHAAAVHGDHHRDGAFLTLKPFGGGGHGVNSIIPGAEHRATRSSTPDMDCMRAYDLIWNSRRSALRAAFTPHMP